MKFGFFINKFVGFDILAKNVLGEELYAKSMCKYLSRCEDIDFAKVYTTAHPPKEKIDVMVRMNDNIPNYSYAEKNILYLQNGYGEGSDKKLIQLYNRKYDGWCFISKDLLDKHISTGRSGLYLPFGVDLELFYPRQSINKYKYDVAYIGNDIKGIERTERYLYPAINFNFGLFGSRERVKPSNVIGYIKNVLKNNEPPYKKAFERISKGKIPQQDVPYLYSSAKINLNCTLQDCIDRNVITLRTFEVLACKGFLVSDKSDIAEKELKNCVVFSDGGDDLIEKIHYYLNHNDERLKIAENGYNYVINNCGIEKQTEKLLNYIKTI